MRFDPEKHHRRSLRIKDRDYSKEGYYFVTICARSRENIFADFCVGVGLAPTPNDINGTGQPLGLLHPNIAPTIVLTTVGRIIKKNWQKIADQNITTDAFVIMPNHIHGVVIIKSRCLCVGARLALAPDSPPDNDHGRPQGAPLQQKIAPPSTLSSIIGAFKSRCALDYMKYIDEYNLNESSKIWQRNYYEHIIRDNKELTAIRKYIKTNPANWEKDEDNPINN